MRRFARLLPLLDRFGKPIQVGWSEPEELWVRAAITLRGQDRISALWDIAEMTGRSIHAVQRKAEHIASQQRLEAAERAMVTQRVMVPAKDCWPLARRRRAVSNSAASSPPA